MATIKHTPGILYGIGVGPGNPEWITLEAVRILSSCSHIFAPKARTKQDSLALEIARPHLSEHAIIHELVFPMTNNTSVLENTWNHAADAVKKVLETGEDACFLTIGDSMLYSTFIYLRRSMAQRHPTLQCRAIPGIPAFVAAAALTGIPLGEAKSPLMIIPASDDLRSVEQALQSDVTVVVMKIGEKLNDLRKILEQQNADTHAVLASRIGLPQQHLIPLCRTQQIKGEKAYLSLALIPPTRSEREQYN